MSTTTLNIELDTGGISFFVNTKQKIVLIIPLPSDKNEYIACLAFTPISANNNSVEITNNWSTFASYTSLSELEILKIQASQAITLGKTNILEDIGFKGTTSGISNHIGINNQRSSTSNTTTGITEDFNPNSTDIETNIVSFKSTPSGQTAYFTVTSKIWILAANGISTNMVLPKGLLNPNPTTQSPPAPIANDAQDQSSLIVGTYLEIDLTQTTTVHFNSSTNTFESGQINT